MNDVSSRSHAIFQLIFKQTRVTKDALGNVCEHNRVSKISLVDLAGSERSGQINEGSSSRMKEGNVINQSLSTLGKVMTALADRSSSAAKARPLHVPYVACWFLFAPYNAVGVVLAMSDIASLY
jgi:kinesin family protein 1